jgi:hypothetical protein
MFSRARAANSVHHVSRHPSEPPPPVIRSGVSLCEDRRMVIIHQAQLHPTKLELLTDWLLRRRWYRGPATPTLDPAVLALAVRR